MQIDKNIQMTKIANNLLILTPRNLFVHFCKATVLVQKQREMIQLCSSIQSV